MRNKFEEQLGMLNSMLIEMGAMIETAIAASVEALTKQDVTLAEKTIEYDREIDQKEKDIENFCLKLLLQQQPVARDLRLISSALKIITDMERIGDQAADISEISIHLSDAPLLTKLKHIPQMARETSKMVTESIDAFVKKDLEIAAAVIKHDDIVDRLFVEVKDDLTNLILKEKDYSSKAIDLLMIAKYLERIGDHATNIAEWVVFSITGKHKEG